MGEILRERKERKLGAADMAAVENALPAARLAALVGRVEAGQLSNSAAKEVLDVLAAGIEPAAVAWSATRIGQVTAGQTVLITGASAPGRVKDL